MIRLYHLKYQNYRQIRKKLGHPRELRRADPGEGPQADAEAADAQPVEAADLPGDEALSQYPPRLERDPLGQRSIVDSPPGGYGQRRCLDRGADTGAGRGTGDPTRLPRGPAVPARRSFHERSSSAEIGRHGLVVGRQGTGRPKSTSGPGRRCRESLRRVRGSAALVVAIPGSSSARFILR